MPVRLLTPSSIWTSFQNSRKRHLLITGGKGSGKTTLLKKLFPDTTLPGITTYAVPKKGVYLRENGSENVTEIGVYDTALPGSENKMRPSKEGLSFGAVLLNGLASHQEAWVSIDEIGYLETECPAYCNAIERLMEEKRVIAVLRKQSLPFLQSLSAREDVFVIDLDHPFGNIACVIMASGMGKRFGRNKLTADFHGQPMILRALEETDGIFDKRIVITRHSDVAKLCHSHGVPSILHELPNRNDTVRLGIEAIGKSDACVFCLGDQPLLRRETVVALALAAKNHPEDIWRVRFEETFASPMLFPKWTFAELASLPEGKGGGFLAKKYPERLRTVNARDQFELMDVDTPEDLEFLKQR